MSLRDPEDKSNRTILANAPESTVDTSTAEGEIALAKLKKYKELIGEMDRLEVERSEIIRKAQDLEWKESKTEEEIKQIKRFWSTANRLGNKINTYESQLISLETSEPLRAVLKREKKLEYSRLEQKGKEDLAKYREESYKKTRELMEQWEKQRKEGISIRAKLKAEAEEKAKKETESQKQRKTKNKFSPFINGRAFTFSLLLCTILYLLFLSFAFTEERDTYICYTTKTGTHYHSPVCQYLNTAYETTVYEASKKYKPCDHCNPCVANYKTTITVRNYLAPALISIPISAIIYITLIKTNNGDDQ